METINIVNSEEFTNTSEFTNIFPIGRDKTSLRINHLFSSAPYNIVVKTQEDLAAGNDKFILILETNLKKCLYKNIKNKTIFKDILLPDTIKAINEGRCLLCFELCRDRYLYNYQKREGTMLYLLAQAGIKNFAQIKFITNVNYACIHPQIETIYWECYESTVKQLMSYNCNFSSRLQHASYRFIYLNRRLKLFRLYLFSRLYKEIKNFKKLFATTFNFNFFWYDTTQTYKHIFQKDKKFLPHIEKILPFIDSSHSNKIIESQLLRSFNLSTPVFSNGITDNRHDMHHKNFLWNNVKLYFAPESSYSSILSQNTISSDIILTEKTFKPIQAKLPFIIYGQPGLLQKLHSYGYKTFNSVWCEKYDTIIDPIERANYIIDLLKTFSIMSEEDFNIMIQKTQDIVEYNYSLLMKRQPAQQMFDTFARFCN